MIATQMANFSQTKSIPAYSAPSEKPGPAHSAPAAMPSAKAATFNSFTRNYLSTKKRRPVSSSAFLFFPSQIGNIVAQKGLGRYAIIRKWRGVREVYGAALEKR